MPTFTKAIPANTNYDKLYEDIQAQYPGAIMTRRELTLEVSHANADSGVLDDIIRVHNPATLTTAQQTQATDGTSRTDLLAQAAAGIQQIADDRTALAAATTLAQVRPIVDNILVRQERIIKALRAVLRSGLG